MKLPYILLRLRNNICRPIRFPLLWLVYIFLYVLSSLYYISPLSAFYLICTSLYAILSLLHKIFHFLGEWKPSYCLLIHGDWITFRKDLQPHLLHSETLVPTYLLDSHISKNKTLSAGIPCVLSKIITGCSRKDDVEANVDQLKQCLKFIWRI